VSVFRVLKADNDSRPKLLRRCCFTSGRGIILIFVQLRQELLPCVSANENCQSQLLFQVVFEAQFR
jgi:hypothetical protein